MLCRDRLPTNKAWDHWGYLLICLLMTERITKKHLSASVLGANREHTLMFSKRTSPERATRPTYLTKLQIMNNNSFTS